MTHTRSQNGSTQDRVHDGAQDGAQEGLGRFRTVGEVIAALREASDEFDNAPFAGVAPAGDLTGAADVVGVRVEDGRVVIDTHAPATEPLLPVYVNDRDRPDVESPAEALQAVRDHCLRWGTRVVAYGTPIRNEEQRRWEVPVQTRPLPKARQTPPVMEIPAKYWKAAARVQLDHPTQTAACCCCGKQSAELIVMFIPVFVESRGLTFRDRFQVDIRHYARRTGVTVDDVHRELAEEKADEARRVREAFTAREPHWKRGWAVYGPDGIPLIERLFKNRNVAGEFLTALQEMFAPGGDAHNDRIEALVDRFGGHASYDGPVQPVDPPKQT